MYLEIYEPPINLLNSQKTNFRRGCELRVFKHISLDLIYINTWHENGMVQEKKW